MTIQGSAWSTSDFASGAGYNAPVLSAANLTCQLTSNNNNSTVPVSVAGLVAGKYYVEFTPVAGASRGLAVGLVQNSQSRLLGSGSLNTTGCAMLTNAGTISVNNANVGSTGAVMANGVVSGLALDLTGKSFWARQGAAGNWNNSGVANPALGIGGIPFATLSGVLKLIAWECSFSSPPVTVTLNSGSSAFGGVVPVGFTPGWPTDNVLNQMLFNTLF